MSLFWTNPTALFWTDPSALFWVTTAEWTQTEVGGATGSFSSSSGAYTVSGTGSGVEGTSDSLYFVNQPASGNIEFIAQVTEQTGTNAYAIAGLMLSDSLTSSDPQCALIGVSPENGVNFSWRTADGDSAELQLGPSMSAPIWLRLEVSQTSVAGYQSSDGINWVLVGETTMTLPSDYYVGLAVSSNASASNTATFTDLAYLTNVVQRSTNLVSWLRADVGVTYDGSAQVSLWSDQSSNGFNGSQGSLENQPTLCLNAANGLPAIEFTPGSSGQFLQFPEGFDFTSGLSLFVVLNPSTMAAGETILDFRNYSGGTSSDQFGVSEMASSGGAEFYAFDGTAGSSGEFASALTADEFQLLEVIYDGISSVSVYTNGSLAGTQGGLQTLAGVTRSDNYIGQAGSGGDFFSGQIAEILIFDTNLSAANREAVEEYLLAKYLL